MSTLIPGPQLRTLLVGAKVDRAAATLPQTATGNIFTITGGRIILLGLAGQVTTAIGAVATTLSIGTVPTVGTASVLSIASAVAITSKEVGTLLGLAPVAGGALVVGGTSGNAGGVTQLSDQGGYVVPAGAISITTSASDTGALSWSALWVPFDDGASLAAA